ncbi:MAG: MOFRL family protein, partial [Pseudomonadota bacterium]
AQVATWVISDVPGDDPAVIGSGPTVPLPAGEAPEDILERRGVSVPASLLRAMASNPAPSLAPADIRMVATPQMALEAAAEAARLRALAPVILSDRMEGEAREVGAALAGVALQVAAHGQPAPRPCVILSGGETTVTVRGHGRGGRNAEFLLALAVALGPEAARHGIWALAADTDGIDGIEANAGAILTPDAWARAEALGLNLRARLDDNDGFGAFEALGDLLFTGPTMTNVNDFRAILLP